MDRETVSAVMAEFSRRRRRVEHTCPVCGRTYVAGVRSRYCSARCRKAGERQRKREEGTPDQKPPISPPIVSVHYDPEADALHVKTSEQPIAQTVNVGDGELVDLAEDGSLVGVDVLFVSERDERNRGEPKP